MFGSLQGHKTKGNKNRNIQKHALGLWKFNNMKQALREYHNLLYI